MQPPSQDDNQPPLHFSNQAQFQQLQPHMMLCPVQYVYEPQVMVPPEEQAPPHQTPTFQNQSILLNVQNTPPWIQNRPNMVYMPQMQMSNMQPYIQQHMVPNPMYNYQYQPMIMHDQIRHIVPYMNQNMMQNPHIVQNVVQNPQTLAQNVMHNQSPIQNSPHVMNAQNIMQSPIRLQMEQKPESPLLSQILQNNMAKQAQTQHNEFVSPMQIIRPHYQNVRPQMIIVNPIAPAHTCMHNQKEPPNVPVERPKTEVPLQIRKQIPEGLSVKTVFKLSSTATVKPSDYVQNIAPVDEAHPRVYPKPVVKPVSNRDPQTNYKRKIREIIDQNTKDENEVQIFKRNCLVNKQEAINKQSNTVSIVVDMPTTNATESQNMNSGSVANERPQNEQNATDRLQSNDKLLRNTVYVQARGIVNEPAKTETQNTSTANNQNCNMIKVNYGTTETEREFINNLGGSVVISVVDDRRPNVGGNSSQNDSGNIPETVLMNGYNSKTQNDLTITEIVLNKEADAIVQDNLTVTQNVPSSDVKVPSVVETDNLQLTQLSNNPDSDDAKLRKILKMARFRHSDDADSTLTQNNSKDTELSNNNECDDTKVRKNPKITQFLHSDDVDGSMTRKNSKMTQILLSNNAGSKVKTHKELKMKSKELKNAQTENMLERGTTQRNSATDVLREEENKIYVLTHVLDGHIIQESNVPFIVQKPILTRRNTNSTSPTNNRKTEPSNNLETSEMRTNLEPNESRTNLEANDSRTNLEANELGTNLNANESGTNLDSNLEHAEVETTTNEETEPKNDAEEGTETNTENEEGETPPAVTETLSETAEQNEDDPFALLSMPTVKIWTVADLASHLMDYESWQDTAQKMLEEEVDGESLLLVNKEQLIQIGINEEHSDVVCAFLERELKK